MPVPVIHVCDKFGVAGSSIHGVSRLFSWWFPRYDRSRYDVSLVGLKAPEPASAALEATGIPVHHLGRSKFDPRTLGDLAAIARARGARILHVHGYAAADFGRLAARRIGARLVLHEHFADPRLPAYQALADRLLAGLTDSAIAVSASTRDFLVGQRFVPADRVRLIWNGAPLDEFAPVSADAARALRKELGIPDAAPVVGSVGRLSLQKGHRFLIAAAPEVLAVEPQTRFLIVGDGDQLEASRRRVTELGIASRFVFAGHRTDIPRVLGAIDIFCITSTYEGTPLALFEAMASGKAVVSTAVDGCREVIEDGVSGRLVPAEDPSSLAAALVALLRSPSERQRLADNARRAALRYDIATCVRQMEALYDELLRGPRAA